ncbi:ComF family protein [Vibrio lamellibrachiae]|uniref:ComF family protein n=1 Tax=Vibrio lamellibrachiae TaxID=2910253 RepID=UPI003D113A64
MLSDWLQKTMHQHVGCYCDLCRLPIEPRHRALAHLPSSIWCYSCLALFAPTPRCLRCGLTTITTTPQCGQCLSNPPLWSSLYCVGDYTAPLSGYIHRFKYQQQFWHAKPLSALLSLHIDSKPELITCVPLHWQRYLLRGFNQSELLAKQLAKIMSIPTSTDLFSRIKHTPQQKGLNKRQRQKNLQQAFRLNFNPKQKHIAIFDDVVTTGSTTHHLCKLLLDAGVETIDIYCICRTPELDNSI